MATRMLFAVGVVAMSTALAHADGDVRRGAAVYRACVACHSLEPGVHLTGPSLAGLWGKKTASVADYPRYSKALKAQAFFWDETSLNAWIAGPDDFVKGSAMTFGGIKNDKARADLIAFLKLALAPGGAQDVVAKGLLPARLAGGQRPGPLDQAGPDAQVVSVRHCHNTFFVVTADGNERAIWEMNLRLKVDSGPTGPKNGKPVLTPGGMQGDRSSLIFRQPEQISTFIQGKC